MKIIVYTDYGMFEIPYYIMEEYAKQTNREIFYYLEDYIDNGKKFTRVEFDEINPKHDWKIRYKSINYGDEIKSYYNDYDFNSKLENLYSHDTDFIIEDIRTNKLLINIIEKNSESCTCLGIVEIPDDVDWEIEDYDGAEWVSEKHRKWYAD